METNATAVSDILSLTHLATSTESANFGTGILFNASTLCTLTNCANATTTATSTSRIASILTGISTTTPSADLAFYTKKNNTGLTEAMRITSTGNLGIGTTTPFARLDIASSSASASNFGQLALTDTNAGANLKHWLFSSEGGNLYIGTTTDAYATSTTPGLTIIGSSGNAGIGTTTPLANLVVETNGTPTIRGIVSSQTSADGSSAQLNLLKARGSSAVQNGDFIGVVNGTGYDGTNYTTGARLRFIVNGAVSSGSVPTDLQFFTGSSGGGTEYMRITSAGNVGIGTTSPGNLLQITTATSDTIPALGANGGKFGIFNANGAGPYGMLMGITNSGDSFIQEQRIDGTATAYNILLQPSGGKVSIGTSTAPNAALDISGSASVGQFNSAVRFTESTSGSSRNWAIGNGAGANYGTLAFLVSSANGGSPTNEKMSIDSSGNVGIGVTSVDSKFRVLGTTANDGFRIDYLGGGDDYLDANANIYLRTAGALRFNINSTGIIGLNTANYQSCSTALRTDVSAVVTCAASDARLKKNITPIGSESSLAAINALNPVTFDYIDPGRGAGEQMGLIAQEVQQVLPDLIATTSPTALTPGGTLTVDYMALTAPIVKAIQELDIKLESIASSTPMVPGSFAEQFYNGLIAQITVWLADAGNGIGTVVASAFHAKDEICVDDQCLTKDDVRSLLALARNTQAPTSGGIGSPPADYASTTPENPATEPAGDSQAPVIAIQGDNPATIHVGDTYADLGAIVTDNVDQNVGYKVSLDGGEAIDASALIVETSTSTTHTLIYSAVDVAGNTSSASRTVIVE